MLPGTKEDETLRGDRHNAWWASVPIIWIAGVFLIGKAHLLPVPGGIGEECVEWGEEAVQIPGHCP